MKPTLELGHLVWVHMLGMFLNGSLLFAVTAKPTPTVVHQPDGSFLIVRGFGDEFYHFAENEDGYTVLMNETNWWVYAELGRNREYVSSSVKVSASDHRAEAESRFLATLPKHLREDSNHAIRKRESALQKRNGYPDKAVSLDIKETQIIRSPLKWDHLSSGTLRVLVLLVKFPDMPNVYPAQSFQRMFNDDAWELGSVNTYYKVNTSGKVQVVADYKGWMPADHPSPYYAKRNPDFLLHVKELVRAAVNQAEIEGADFSQYDNDGDGIVDALFVVHAGPGAEEGVRTQYIWSHASSLSSNGLNVKYDGVTIDDYTVEPELENNQHAGIGVFCHEFGHQLGLPDLYDTDYGKNGESSGLGFWDLMAAGSWGANGNNVHRPASLSAWSKEFLGLVNPAVVSNSQSISVRSGDPCAVYKVWLDPYKDSEYLLIENRQKKGFDQDMPGSGLFIYHIDRNLSENFPFSNSINATRSHPGVSLLQADGQNQLELNFNEGDAGDPFPGMTGNRTVSDLTNPGTTMGDGSHSGVTISGIDHSSDLMKTNVVASPAQGYSQQYYQKVHGLFGIAGRNVAYGLIRFTPEWNGKLRAMKVLLNESYSNLQVKVYRTFTAENPSNLLASGEVNDPAFPAFHEVRFNPGVDVLEGLPVYVELRYTRKDAWYQIPIDFYTPSFECCYVSFSGSRYLLMNYNIAARAVFSSSDVVAPTLVFPLNGEKDKPVQIVFRWSASSNADSYHIQVGQDSLFQQVVYDNPALTGTSQPVAGLLPDVRYFWRVMAKNANGSSSWSGVSTFQTAVSAGLPARVILDYPSNGSNGQLVTTTFSWNASEGALTYRFQIASDSLFRSVVYDDSVLNGTSIQPASLHKTMKYYWRVNAGNAKGRSAWSEVWTCSTVNFDSSRWALYDASNTILPENNMDPIAIDSRNNKWVGSGMNGYGLAQFDGKAWRLYTHSNSELPSDTVWTIAAGLDRSVWIGTHNGLSNLNKDVWTHFNRSNSRLPYNDIRALALDGKGNLWIGTAYGGLAKYDGSMFTVYTTSTGLPSNDIFSVALEDPDRVWAGTYKGLTLLDRSGCSIFNTANSDLPSDVITSIAVDRHDKIWIGTPGGLSVFDRLKWSTFNTENSKLPYNGIHSIYVDSYENVWITTRNGGLVKIHESDWTIYNSTNSGFVSDALRHIAIDSNETKWITSDGGLIEFRQLAPLSPVLAFPVDGAVDSHVPVTLSWAISPESDGYQLQVSTTPDFSAFFLDRTQMLDTSFALTGLNKSTVYYWRVRAENKGGVSGWSAVRYFTTGVFSAVELVEISGIPKEFFLSQNYPNPFNPTASIRFGVKEPCRVVLKVYDLRGRQVKGLIDDHFTSGQFEIQFNASGFLSGIYFCKIEMGDYHAVRKMVLTE